MSNTSTPLVSILVPCYNSEKFISQTLASCINQTWKNTEIIAVDDGSKDNTYNILKRYEAKNVKIIRQDNRGASFARNMALSEAQGDYIQWLDHDDILDYRKIENQLNSFDHINNKDWLISSQYGTFYNDVRKAKMVYNKLCNDLSPNEYLYVKFSENMFLQTSVWLVSRYITDKVGPWLEIRSLDDDGEYFCRLVASSNKIKYVANAISYWRIGNYTARTFIREEEDIAGTYETTIRNVNLYLSLENSPRSRKACLSYLQTRYDRYNLEYRKYLELLENLANTLDGRLQEPTFNWKYNLVKNLLGNINANTIKAYLWKLSIMKRKIEERWSKPKIF